MNTETILEIKEKYSGERQTFRCRLLAQSEGEAVVLYRLEKRTVLHGLTLLAGDISIGYFWESRPYNVYHFLRADGETVAFYINISDRTRITPGQIFWRDLVVDLIIFADGNCRVVDEDELPADMDGGLLATITAARDEVLLNCESLSRQWEQQSAIFV